MKVWISLKKEAYEKLYWKEAPTKVFFCEYCKTFKNNYLKNIVNGCFWSQNKPKMKFEKAPVFFKANVLKYSLKATEWHLYWSVFLMKLHALKPRTRNHEHYKFSSWINSVNKQHGWRGETRCAYVERSYFILSRYSFTKRELSPIRIIQ